MRLGELLPREHIVVPLRAATLRQAIDELLGRLEGLGRLRDTAPLAAALTGPGAREVVCIGPQVALPHWRTERVDRLLLALGTAPQPLATEGLAADAAPQLVVLILAPPDDHARYLQIVSALASLFRDDRMISRIIDAASPDEVLELTRAAELRVLPRLTVRDIMSQDVRPVTPATPVREAVDIMVRKRLRALPVIGDKEEVLGVISERDIMRGLMPRAPRGGEKGSGADGDELSVRDVMTRSVLCVSEDLGLEEAAQLMINKDVEQLPVTAEGKLTGFVTRGDLIRKLFAR